MTAEDYCRRPPLRKLFKGREESDDGGSSKTSPLSEMTLQQPRRSREHLESNPQTNTTAQRDGPRSHLCARQVEIISRFHVNVNEYAGRYRSEARGLQAGETLQPLERSDGRINMKDRREAVSV